MRIAYARIALRSDKRRLIEQANAIIEEYADDGYLLTVRQIYYQFIARDLFPDDRCWSWDPTRAKWYRDANGTKNAQPNYKWLADALNDGRMTGRISWEAIEDRTRSMQGNTHWSGPERVIDAVAKIYATDKWAAQATRVEVWVEKEALIGIFEAVCADLDVPYLACRGYLSQSEMWRAARRHRSWGECHQKVVVLHFGDHDPSGIDMTRDIRDRLCVFESPAKVRRIALTQQQIRRYRPPPSPAKTTDARFDAYRAQYGDESWELDALEPRTLTQLVRREVSRYRDDAIWSSALAEQEAGRKAIQQTADHFDHVVDYLREFED
jgi:hypothetical protein